MTKRRRSLDRGSSRPGPIRFGGGGGEWPPGAPATGSSLLRNLARAARDADSVAGLLRLAVEILCREEGWPVGHAVLDDEPSGPGSPGPARSAPVVPTDIWHLEDPDRFAEWKDVVSELRLADGERLSDRVRHSGTPAWIEDLDAELRFAEGDPEPHPPVRGALAVPVLAGQDIHAVLEFYDTEPRSPEPASLERLADVCWQLGWALELKGWEMDNRDSRLRLRMIVEAMQDIASAGVDPDAVMEVTAQRSMELTGATGAGVYLLDEDDADTLVLQGAAGNALPYLGTSFSISDTLSGHAFRSGNVLASGDAFEDPRVNQEIVRAKGVRSFITVPLHANDGEIVGLLNVMSNRVDWFDPEDVQLLRLLSHHMGSSLDRARAFRANVRLLDDLVRTAGKLENSLKQREALLDASLHPIIAMDEEVRLTVWSRAAEELYGWTAEEVLGEPLPIVPEERRMEAYANIARVRSGEVIRHVDVVHVRKDGARIPVRISAAPIETGNGATHVVAVITDRSEMRRVERRLLQAERMESIGRLAGGIAQDFNNMLTAIRGHADLLATFDLPAEAEDSIRDIVKAVEHSTNITEQLLAYSRRQVLEARIVYPSDAIDEMSTLLDRLLGERIKLELDLEAEAGPILIDPARLDQVVMNLVVNARDAMPRGGEIRIECVGSDAHAENVVGLDELDPGSVVRISVSDDGAGIPPEIQGHIFEPFFTTKEPGQGTGLGLATVYGTVHQSGGTIRVDSAPGSGTTFDLFFPVAEPEEAARETVEGDGDVPEILLVEETDIVERLVRRILEPRGYRIVTARSHRGALDRLECDETRPDLLVTDATRVATAFQQFLRSVRKARPSLPIVVLTDDPAVAAATPPGMTRIQKPFSPMTLEAAVGDALAARSRP